MKYHHIFEYLSFRGEIRYREARAATCSLEFRGKSSSEERYIYSLTILHTTTNTKATCDKTFDKTFFEYILCHILNFQI